MPRKPSSSIHECPKINALVHILRTTRTNKKKLVLTLSRGQNEKQTKIVFLDNIIYFIYFNGVYFVSVYTPLSGIKTNVTCRF